MKKTLLITLALAIGITASYAVKPTQSKVGQTNKLLPAQEIQRATTVKTTTFGYPEFMKTDKNQKLKELRNNMPMRTSNYVSSQIEDVEIQYRLTRVTANANANPNAATIVLSAGNVWGDGSGYQLLLDANHNIDWGTDEANPGIYGSFYVANVAASVYAQFEYKIPTNADGNHNTTNVVVNRNDTIEIPGGTYDFLVTNPTPGTGAGAIVYLAGSGASEGDDVVFKNGVIYTFTVTLAGTNDYVALTSTDVPPSAYKAPQGTLFLGRAIDNYSLIATQAIAPAYSQWTFKNATVANTSQTSLWNYNEKVSSTTIPHSATTTDLSFNVTNGLYSMPKLTTTLGGQTTDFTLGATSALGALVYEDGSPAGNSEANIQAGGGTVDGAHKYNLTNANPDYESYNWTFGDDANYVYGTGTAHVTNNTWGLVSYFEGNPQGMIYFDTVQVFLGALSGPALTELKLTIVKASKNAQGYLILGDTIATAITTIGDALHPASDSYILTFGEFVATDEFGSESPIEYLEIENGYALILTGYLVNGVTLSVLSEYLGTTSLPQPGKDRTSYWLQTTPQGQTGLVSYTYFNNTPLFSLVNAYYTYITSETSQITAATSGGLYSAVLVPYFNGVWVENDLPEWITVSFADNFTSTAWNSTATITVAPLSGSAGRYFDIEFATWGARKIVRVIQGTVGVETAQVSDVKAANVNGAFELTYSNQYNAVSLYDIAGKQVATFALPDNGKFNIPAANLNNGVYILRFTGKSNAAVKVIK